MWRAEWGAPPVCHTVRVTTRSRHAAVDSLKGLAVLSVIVLHSFSVDQLRSAWAWFHIWQAVPVLAVLLGYTARYTRFAPLGTYVARRAIRLLPAFAAAWVVSLALGILYGGVVWDWTIALGRVPRPFPGSYFVMLLLQWVLVAPLVWWGHRRSPAATLAAAFLLDVAFEIVCWRLGIGGFFYAGCVLRYLFAASLGMWLAGGRRVWPFALAGLAVLVAHAFGWRVPVFPETWQPQNALAAGYAAGMVALGLRLLEHTPRWLAEIGRASYHVFLFQGLWFISALASRPGQVPLEVALALLSLVVCSVAGVAWYRLESLVVSGSPWFRTG